MTKILRNTLVIAGFQLFTFASVQAAPEIITWDDLIPTDDSTVTIDYSKIPSTIDLVNVDDFNGNQEILDEYLIYLDNMRALQSEDGDSIAMSMDKQSIKIAGYVTPISFEGEIVTEFLFVPFLGACIHIPPPPANQIIYVENAEGLTMSNLYDPVYLVGELNAKPVATMVANIGYTIENGQIEPYDEPELDDTYELIEVTE